MSGGLVNIKSISMTERERIGLKPKNNKERGIVYQQEYNKIYTNSMN